MDCGEKLSIICVCLDIMHICTYVRENILGTIHMCDHVTFSLLFCRFNKIGIAIHSVLLSQCVSISSPGPIYNYLIRQRRPAGASFPRCDLPSYPHGQITLPYPFLPEFGNLMERAYAAEDDKADKVYDMLHAYVLPTWRINSPIILCTYIHM